MNKELLPSIKYRISIHYSKVENPKSISYTTCDSIWSYSKHMCKNKLKAQSHGNR